MAIKTEKDITTPNVVAKVDVFIEKVHDGTHNISHLSAAGDTFS